MANEKIDIKDLNKADVLAVLYNASKPLGMGFVHYDPTPMTREQAQELLDAGKTYFDYLKGRVMKIDLSSDELNPWGYDRDNGPGAAQCAIDALCSQDDTNPASVAEAHKTATHYSAQNVKGRLHEIVDEAIKKLDDLKR